MCYLLEIKSTSISSALFFLVSFCLFLLQITSEVHTEQSSERLILAVYEDLLLTVRASQRGWSLTSMILVEEKERRTVGAKQPDRLAGLSHCLLSAQSLVPLSAKGSCCCCCCHCCCCYCCHHHHHHYFAELIFTLLLSGSTKIKLHQYLPLGKHSSAHLQYMKLQ